MAGVRDPAFWKRFSVAVHLDEEHAVKNQDSKQNDDWLTRQNAKRSRRTKICWAFWTSFLVLVALVVIVIVWLLQSGMLKKMGLQSSTPNT